jgi:hypothetical protein
VLKNLRRKRESSLRNGDVVRIKELDVLIQLENRRLNGLSVGRLRSKSPESYWSAIKLASGYKLPSGNGTASFTANELNNFFLRYDSNSSPIFPCFTASTVNESVPVMSVRATEALLRRSKNLSSLGPDGIPSSVLRQCSAELSLPLCEIFNKVILSGSIPPSWKRVKITPVPKIPAPKEMNHFRPVAMTSSYLKCLEYFLLDQLNPFLSLSVDPFQFAYKGGLSCDDAVVCLLDFISRSVDNRGTICRATFLDQSSAFNTIDRSVLMSDLSANHTPDWLLRILVDYFSGRVQFVKFSGCMSGWRLSNSGVLQGAVLSPRLFSFKTASLYSPYPNVIIVKFADDIAVAASISNESDLHNYFSAVSRISFQCKE